mgnify:FL=1
METQTAQAGRSRCATLAGRVPWPSRHSGQRRADLATAASEERHATHLTSQSPNPRYRGARASDSRFNAIRQRPTRDTELGVTSRSFVQGNQPVEGCRADSLSELSHNTRKGWPSSSRRTDGRRREEITDIRFSTHAYDGAPGSRGEQGRP